MWSSRSDGAITLCWPHGVRFFAASGAAGALCLVMGLYGYLNDGLEERFDERVLKFARGVNDRPS